MWFTIDCFIGTKEFGDCGTTIHSSIHIHHIVLRTTNGSVRDTESFYAIELGIRVVRTSPDSLSIGHSH